jgi:hypothetical protein
VYSIFNPRKKRRKKRFGNEKERNWEIRKKLPFATPFNHYNNKYVYMDFFLYARWFSYALRLELSGWLSREMARNKKQQAEKKKKGRSVKNGKISIDDGAGGSFFLLLLLGLCATPTSSHGGALRSIYGSHRG